MVHAVDGPLPSDTLLVVRYGSNQEGEPYALGQPGRKQAVFCEEDTVQGGGPAESPELGNVASPGGAGGEGGARPGPTEPGAGGADPAVWALRCRLYTQGPALVDVTATGYESIAGRALSLSEEDRCEVKEVVALSPLTPEVAD